MTFRFATTVLILLVVAVAINYLDRGALSVSAPLITRELNLSTNQMGLLFSAFFWTYSTFQLVAGWMVDRFPIKWVYAGGFLIWSLATAAVGIANSLSALLLTRLFLGMGESVAYPASSKVIVCYFPEERRGLANALVDAGSKIGPGLSTLLGGLAVDKYGWRGMFLVAGLASLIWLIPWLILTESRSATQQEKQTGGPGWREILRQPQVWGTSIGMFALGYVLYFLLSWLPSYLVKERGLSVSSMATLGSIPFWAMAAASLIGGWTSDRLIAGGRAASKVRKLYAAGGLLLCGAVILPAPIVADSTSSVALITIACVFLGLFTSNVWAITQTLAGTQAAGKWTGIQNAVGNMGGVISPLVTGWIVSETGSFSLAFWAAAAVLALGALAYLTMLGEVEPLTWSEVRARDAATV